MRRAFLLMLMLLAVGIYVVLTGCSHSTGSPSKKISLEGKKVLFVVPSADFRDEELKEPMKLLQEKGAKAVLSSSTTEEIEGMLGMRVKPDILLKEVDVDQYDAVIFVGGSGADEYWDNATAQEIAVKANKKRKVIGAICLAPVTLAKAGLLDGKRATVFHSAADKLNGAIYTKDNVVIDGNIITASGPESAVEFVRAVAAELKKQN